MTKDILKIKMCSPDRDAVCLQGGCVYCDNGKFIGVASLEAYAKKHKLLDAFKYGYNSRWPNRIKKVAE